MKCINEKAHSIQNTMISLKCSCQVMIQIQLFIIQCMFVVFAIFFYLDSMTLTVCTITAKESNIYPPCIVKSLPNFQSFLNCKNTIQFHFSIFFKLLEWKTSSFIIIQVNRNNIKTYESNLEN